MGTVRHSTQPRPLGHGGVCGGTTIHGGALGLHRAQAPIRNSQMLREASGLQGVTGLWGSKGCVRSPQRAQDSSLATGGGAGLGGNKRCPGREQATPHVLCDGTGTQEVRREGRAPRGGSEVAEGGKTGW